MCDTFEVVVGASCGERRKAEESFCCGCRGRGNGAACDAFSRRVSRALFHQRARSTPCLHQQSAHNGFPQSPRRRASCCASFRPRPLVLAGFRYSARQPCAPAAHRACSCAARAQADCATYHTSSGDAETARVQDVHEEAQSHSDISCARCSRNIHRKALWLGMAGGGSC